MVQAGASPGVSLGPRILQQPRSVRGAGHYAREMGIEVQLTADGLGAVYLGFGRLSGDDLLEADRRMRLELERNPGIRYLLIDHSEVSEQGVDTASLRALAERAGDVLISIPSGFVAIAAPTPVMFGLSRMWEMLAGQPGLATRVARTRSEALAWLEGELKGAGLAFDPAPARDAARPAPE